MADYNINAVTRRVVFSGSAGTGPYAFTFEILDENDIAVYFNATLLTLTTDYTVSINANGTGSVTIVVGTNVPTTPDGDDSITIVGARDIERTTDFVTAGDFRASAINEQLDALTIFDQQISERVDRSIIAPVTDPTTIDMTLPAKADRLGKALLFNSSTGNPEAGPTATEITNAQTYATNASNSASAASASASAASSSASAASSSASAAATSETNAEAVATGISFTFNATTTMADPGAGVFRMNNATVASVTSIAFDATSAESGNPDVSDFIATWDDVTNATGSGVLTLKKAGTPATFAVFYVTAVTDNTGWLEVTVSHIASNGTWSASDRCFFQFVASGADGSGTLSNVVEDTTPQLGGFLDANGNYIEKAKGADIASASTLVVGTDGDMFDITGTTTITGMTVAADRSFTLQFDGALTLTHGASLVLPTTANITTAAGDVATFQSIAANTVICTGYLRADGTPLVSSGGLTGFQVYSASDTWAKPAGLTHVIVEVVGGGAGGSGSNGNDPGGGGAAGGYSRKYIAVASLGSTETVTIGAGGSGGGTNTAGSAGGTSSFGAHASATGCGAGPNIRASGTPGSGASGDLNIKGGAGGPGSVESGGNIAGSGGSSVLGGGGQGLTSGGGTGSAGGNYGGGGAGGSTSGSGESGGAGAGGVVIVWEYGA